MTNEERLEGIYSSKKYLTSDDVKREGIPSWFLSDFVKRMKLIKLAPGFYSSPDWPQDDYFILQWRYPKFVFSGLSALSLLGLTEKVVGTMEVTAPFGYHPTRAKITHLEIHYERNPDRYSFGIIEGETIFGNKVRAYGYEKTIVDMIRHRKDYDDEVFIKALKWYARMKGRNTVKLYEYAKLVHAEKAVSDLMEIVTDEN
ncbi:MAG: type IV toxin-antitoxin system AbiEi family antitoxin domain-containing protein [Bacilli bacterium]|jgi:predicted transcriptional regulator of viral defense system|nr:type IV toxin-antitoxin system AbiEi family antitoxin domain-containing protein [Bacilli bacterium]